jgi:hypothetical protein
MTRKIKLTLHVRADGTIDVDAPTPLPPGDHEAVVELPPARRSPARSLDDFPVSRTPWDPTASFRREDIYGDDGH